MTILVVEGADQSGKTTLCRMMVEYHGARYMHARVWRDMIKWHAGIMRRAVRLHQKGELVVLDRHWVSDWVYGPIYRGQTGYSDDEAQAFDIIVRSNGGYILCVPSDMPGQLARHAVRAKKGHEIYRADPRIRQVMERYADLAHGNLAHVGDTILDRYIRHQDFKPMLVYDMDKWSADKAARQLAKFHKERAT